MENNVENKKRFEDYYSDTSDKDKEENKDKKIISDDTFAICQFLQLISDKLEMLRAKL